MSKQAKSITGNRRVTISDVARAASVTAMTVSNVINGRRGEVGATTIERVLRVCTELGYRPDASARTLRTSRKMAIGIVIVDPNPNYLADPFTAAFLAGINDLLVAQNYSIVLHGASSQSVDSLPFMQRIETDGLCVFLSGSVRQRQQIAQQLLALGQPTAFVQEDRALLQGVEGTTSDVCTALQDDFGGGVAVGRHLLLEGGSPRHAAMLVPGVEWPAMALREAGFRSVLTKLEEPPAFHVIRCGDESFDATQAALSEHIKAHGVPDTIFGGNDRMAVAGMKLLADRGIRLPEDVRLAGFNGFDLWRYSTPTLTTVKSPAYELGEICGHALITRIEHGRFPFVQNLLPVELIINASSKMEA